MTHFQIEAYDCFAVDNFWYYIGAACYWQETEDIAAVLDAQMCCDFWERHFGNKDSVTWVAFKDAFAADYGERITTTYGKENEVSINNDKVDCPVCNKTTATMGSVKNIVLSFDRFEDRLESSCYSLEHWASSFTPHCSSSLCCRNELLPMNSCGYLYTIFAQ